MALYMMGFKLIPIGERDSCLMWVLNSLRPSEHSILGSDNGLSPGRRQAIIWTKDGILLIGTLGTNLSEILSEIHAFSIKKMHLKMSSAK